MYKSPFLQNVQRVLRLKGYSYATEKSYIQWVYRYIRFHNNRHPTQMGTLEVESFLSHLAVKRNVASSTQNQALNALVFLYRHVLELPLENVNAFRSKKPIKLPVVLNRMEIKALLYELTGHNRLLASLMYGTGLRVSESLRLRVKDIDFQEARLHIHQSKGQKDRYVPLHPALLAPLQRHLANVKQWHDTDLAAGYGSVFMPNALERKYPKAATSWAWQYVFPSQQNSIDPRSSTKQRHHIHVSSIQGAIRTASKRANILKPVGPHTLRHSFATHAIENGVEIHRVKDILGHLSIETTKIYLHVTAQSGHDFKSPLDQLFSATTPLSQVNRLPQSQNMELQTFLDAIS